MTSEGTGTVTDDGRARVLADGVVMPLLGLGVWQTAEGRETEQAVTWALEAGYRHIDTAQAYGNEASVGAGLRASSVPREDLFITTKFYPGAQDPEDEAEESLRRLGLDHLDLYLVHWPQGGPTRHWSGMERALERGLTRAIGVSNYSVADLDAVLEEASSPPQVNQVEFSPFTYRRDLLAACEARDIALEAYSPLTHGREIEHPTITAIAERLGRTPAQVLLRWGIERDVVVIPKSRRRERIEENAQIFDFRLEPEDLAELDALDRTDGTAEGLENPWW